MSVSGLSEPAAALAARANDRIVLSGCSGGGKSSLLAELARRHHSVFSEAGRDVVREQTLIGGQGTPWTDLTFFVELTVSRAVGDALESTALPGLSFFDRSVIDQLSGLESAGLPVPAHIRRAVDEVRYNKIVFLVPPWPEIFANDTERRHGFADAEKAYHHLLCTYERFGYDPLILPKASVTDRADWVLASLS